MEGETAMNMVRELEEEGLPVKAVVADGSNTIGKQLKCMLYK